MNNREQIQGVKREIMDNMGWSTDETVQFIATLMDRSPATVYRWLTVGMPQHLLELLHFRLSAESHPPYPVQK